MLRFMGLQRVGHNQATELNDPITIYFVVSGSFFLITFLCFLSREDPLVFVEELVWWC